MSSALGNRSSNTSHWCRPLQGVVRAVCAIIDAFHFLPPAEAAASVSASSGAAPDADTAEAATAQASEAAAAAAGIEPDELGGGGQQEADELLDGQQEAAAAQAADIRAALLKRVLPALSKQLVAKGDVSGQSPKYGSVTHSDSSSATLTRCR
jgi:hypothetical protein